MVISFNKILIIKFNKDNDVLKEVFFVNGATEVTGFVNQTNDDFTQYLELQRARDMIWIDDFVDGELYEFDASDPDSQELFNERFLKDLAQQTSTANRFWGWQCGSETTYPGGYCERTCTYRVFWTKVRLSNGKFSQSFPCDDLPGSNPRLVN
ncbi:hypothetical protein ACSSV5_001197 [Psychroflexus sp. MBR-150]|jgi:hypothetical protein